jgi:hypothetical protein
VSDMDHIETKALALRRARDTLTERAQSLHEQLMSAQRKAMRGLRTAVASVTEAEAELKAAVQQAPQLFERPRSVVMHGVKLGYQKGKGKIEWEDDARVVKLIRKHFNDQFDVLVKTTEKPTAAALATLSVDDLKRLGITVEGTGDVVFVKDTTAGVDKLVKALLKGAEEEAAED